jgi:acid phosphatase (class A)
MSRHKYLLPLILLGLCVGPSIGLLALQEGYIDQQSFDVTVVLPAAPVKGTDRYEFDRRIFHATRGFQNTQCWTMATNDVRTDSPHLMSDFSCAAGIVLTPERAPRLAALLARAGADTDAETSKAKFHFKRLRPFLIDPGPICEPASDVENTYDYPSGHTTLGWTWASILAELLPERAVQLLARGRAYGESRIVCGVHNASAVEAGRTSASATLSVVRASPAYQTDFAAARQELATLKSTSAKLDRLQCQAESDLVAQDIFASLSGPGAP